MIPIILYSLPTCPKCSVLKNKMNAKKIDYVINDNVEEMKELGIMAVPVLEVEGVLLNFEQAVNLINMELSN